MKTKKILCAAALLLFTGIAVMAETSNHSWISLKKGMNCGKTPTLTNSEVTVEFWMYVCDDDVKDKTSFVFRNTTATAGMGLTLIANGNAIFKLAEIESVQLKTADISNKWIHIAYVITDSQLLVYGDGQEIAKKAYSGGYVDPNDNQLWIAPLIPWGVPFSGKIADFRVWNVARTQQEIADNMINSDISSDDLLIHYTFQERAGLCTANLGATKGANNGWIGGDVGEDKSLNATWSPMPTGTFIAENSNYKYQLITEGNVVRILNLNSPAIITCYSITGSLISKVNCETSEVKMELQDGISIIQIESKEGISVQKVII